MSKVTETESVWALSSGSYSDYRVHCIVRGTKQDAELLAARATEGSGTYHESYEVEELAVVDPTVERVEILKLSAEIDDQASRAKNERVDIRVEWPFDALYGAPVARWRWVRAPMYHGRGGRLEVWGTDHERVRKVYGDRKGMILTDEPLRRRTEAEGGR